MNKILILGNVGKDPEIRTLESGVQVARITVAVTEKYKNKAGEKVSTTTWFNVTLWRGLATLCEKYIQKGTKVLIEGKMTFRSYDDKDGIKRQASEIVASELTLLSWKNKETEEGEHTHTEQFTKEEIDDLPF